MGKTYENGEKRPTAKVPDFAAFAPEVRLDLQLAWASGYAAGKQDATEDARRNPLPPDWQTIHSGIREARVRLKMKSLARIVGVSDKTVARWEDGTDRPHPSRIPAIVDALRSLGLIAMESR